MKYKCELKHERRGNVACACACADAHARRGWGGCLMLFWAIIHLAALRQGLMDPGVDWLGRLAGKHRSCLAPSPRDGAAGICSHFWHFTWVFGIWTLVLILPQQAFLSIDLSPQLLNCCFCSGGWSQSLLYVPLSYIPHPYKLLCSLRSLR